MAKPQVPKSVVDILNNSWVRWFTTITDRSINQVTLAQSITPVSVGANTTTEQTFAVTGILADDVVLTMDIPTPDTGIVIYNARVSAVDQIKIVYGNVTGGVIVPTAQVYTFYLLRK